jgi:hypothetical protein
VTGPSGISRRIEQCIERLQHRDHEGALVHLFPAIDKTANTRRPGMRVGNRIKAFLKDEEVLITAIGTGHVLKGCKFDGMSFEEALYEFGRTPSYEALRGAALVRVMNDAAGAEVVPMPSTDEDLRRFVMEFIKDMRPEGGGA